MKKINFLFGIHIHQPVGNFLHVFKDAYEMCYLPFLKTVADYPNLSFSLHISGPVFEWMEENGHEALELLAMLSERNQVELMGGGFYEPILPSIPEKDAKNQIRFMQEYIKKRFNREMKGIWLTERIWDPTLPKMLGELGVEYTIIDDTHFRYAGIEDTTITDYYITEHEGHTLKLFPIDMKLRYAIPYKEPQEIIDYLKRVQEEKSDRNLAISFADDGEKFGLWPSTYNFIKEKRWLHRFFEAFSKAHDTIEFSSFGRYVQKAPPAKRIYIPHASYHEMLEWAMPPHAILKYQSLVNKLKEEKIYDEYKPFVRGGFWNNFLTKYEEVNNMHKRMLDVSKRVNALCIQEPNYFGTSDADKAAKHLYMSQCNCSYWHGIFGGTYLNYLRHANYSNIIEAEKYLTSHAIEDKDLDSDGLKEVRLSNNELNAFIKPSYGGSIFEIDFKKPQFNISNCLARRHEAYHDRLTKITSDDGKPKSIHEKLKIKDPRVKDTLFYDNYQRYSFMDHFFSSTITFEDYRKCSYQELGDFLRLPYDYSIDNAVYLQRSGMISDGKKKYPIEIKKSFSIKDASLTAHYTITNNGHEKLNHLFGTELNLTMLAKDAPDRYIKFNKEITLPKECIIEETLSFSFINEWDTFEITCRVLDSHNNERTTTLWHFPVETVSLSEGGFELTYQGSSFTWLFPLTLDHDESLSMSIVLTSRNLP